MTPYVVLFVIVIIIFVFGALVMLASFFRKVEQGKALIINRMRKDPLVTFTGGVVFPIVHKAEVMDISVKTIEIDRRGKEGLICQDNIRADIKVTFFVRVNKTQEDVIKVAQAIGCVRASDQGTLEVLFSAKFSEALKTVGKQLDFVDLYTKRDEFRDRIVAVIGRDLNGYVLEDAAIDFLEQTPLESLDENNILDAQGIRRITELTTIEHVKTNEFLNVERKQIKKQDVDAEEAILELERQKADAVAKQQREIEVMRAREEAEILKVQAEERLRAESARIQTEEELSIAEENKRRQIEVAEKNRERVIAVETERVERERALEEVARTRETEVARIEMEKQLELERKIIAEVTAEKIAVEKTVAIEEEKIKELRVIEEARRTKEAMIINAEAEAEEKLVKDIKAAEAQEEASRHEAKTLLIRAEADLEAADKSAAAKIRLAEGVQAESAAQGLARIQVQEAEASAIERVGLAKVRVRDAEADVMKKEAVGKASLVRERGSAEATANRQRHESEAAGIQMKAEAMAALDDASRNHEEFRLRLEKLQEVELAAIKARREVAEAQATVLAQAFSTANIDIIGGDTALVDRVMSAVTMGKSFDGFARGSSLMDGYSSGEKDLASDLKEILASAAAGSGGLANLSATAVLTAMLAGASDERRSGLEALLSEAKKLGQ